LVIYVLSEVEAPASAGMTHWNVSRLADEATVFVSNLPSEEEALAAAMEHAKEESDGARIIRVDLGGNSRAVADIPAKGKQHDGDMAVA
jgi:hypothetical protein